MFQKVVHKLGETEIKHIKIFQNYKALKIPVGNSYNEDNLMKNLSENIQQGGKYYSHIAKHQAE